MSYLTFFLFMQKERSKEMHPHKKPLSSLTAFFREPQNSPRLSFCEGGLRHAALLFRKSLARSGLFNREKSAMREDFLAARLNA